MPFGRFNDYAMAEAPTRLAIHLAGFEDVTQADDSDAAQCRYAYEFEIGGGTAPRVTGERLYYWPDRAKRRVKLFERDAAGEVTATKDFNLKGFRQVLSRILRPDASVIATLAQLEHPFSKLLWTTVLSIVGNILVDRHDVSDDTAIRHYVANPKLIQVFNREVERIDLGVQSMHMQAGPNGLAAFFAHDGLALPMPMGLESTGTRQFIKLYPYILNALETGGIAVLDELDAAIHPLILPEILRWFADPERNPHDAQLWISCHNASLLEDLIKEEIYFCEKDGSGRTSVYGLRDIQSVRRTDNYYRKYLGGVFGAVPHIG